MSDATKGESLAAIERSNGPDGLRMLVLAMVTEADMVCGGLNAPQGLAIMANLVIQRWKNRSVNGLVMAFRDGFNSGKVYGKLTYPVIAEWLTAHEEALEAHHYQQHLSK